MRLAADLLRDARKKADLSMRGLAIRADVAYTTVQRIEQGTMDPTVGMLRKLLAAMGEELELGCSSADIPELATLVDAWHTNRAGHDLPDWTRLRAFLDYLQLHPHLCGPATLRKPPPSGSVVMDNFLAAIAEKICDDAELPRPAWASAIPALQEEIAASGTPRMQQITRSETPAQFLARGLVVSVYDLWRKVPK